MQKGLVEAVNRYEKQQEERKSLRKQSQSVVERDQAKHTIEIKLTSR